MLIWDRKKECLVEEEEYQKELLEFLYHTILGRILLKLVSGRLFSRIYSLKYMSRGSINKIKPFIEKYHIDLSNCIRTDFRSFNDFFTRQRNYRSDSSIDDVISIADARLFCYEISPELVLSIKNSRYTLQELVGDIFQGNPCQTDSLQLDPFQNGICMVYRLAVEDYHRFVFLDNGTVGKVTEIKGKLHTVRPISEKYRVYSHNNRVCTLLHTDHFGDVIQIEVGALTVGKINNHNVSRFYRLHEKGFFSYGGSTIILLFQKNRIMLAEDILQKNKEGYEVKVCIGDVLGRRVK